MTVRLESHADGRRDLILNRPDKRNALNVETIEALQRAGSSLLDDDSARCVVLRGEGSVFSAGADINEMANLTPDAAKDFIGNLSAAIDVVYRVPVPVVCQLHGACIGGALELAAACDMRVAAATTAFSMPEVLVGIPSVIQAALLPRLMGHGRAGWLILSGEKIDAARAAQWGFVDKTTDADDLDVLVQSAVDQVLSADPTAVRTQKALLRSWDDLPLVDAINQSMPVFANSFASGIPQEIMARFLRPGT